VSSCGTLHHVKLVHGAVLANRSARLAQKDTDARSTKFTFVRKDGGVMLGNWFAQNVPMVIFVGLVLKTTTTSLPPVKH